MYLFFVSSSRKIAACSKNDRCRQQRSAARPFASVIAREVPKGVDSFGMTSTTIRTPGYTRSFTVFPTSSRGIKHLTK